jgi:hypothetical protein
MSRLRMVLLSFLAVFAFSASVSGAAQAAVKGGPIWITKAGELKAGEGRNVMAVSAMTAQILASTAVDIECTSLSVSAATVNKIIGGNPGTDEATLVFGKCVVKGKTEAQCSVHSPKAGTGEVIVAVKTLLGYKKGAAEKEPLYDEFFPAAENNEFATLEFVGTSCGTLTGSKLLVKATGTEAPKPIGFGKRACSTIAEVGTKSGELVKAESLNLPTIAIAEAELWNSEASKFAVVKCALTAAGATATLNGIAKVELENGEEFGVEV